MKAKATPWDALLGLRLNRLPASASTTLVVDGRKVCRAKAAELCRAKAAELRRARARARYQVERLDPQRMAKRKAWIESHPEQVAEYRRRNRERNRERNRQLQSDWAKRQYHQDPDRQRQRVRDWYARNRQIVLAKRKAEREARRAAKLAAQLAAQKAGRP
ncbi:MAG TPA: hypothetical protein PLF63_04055 [Rubrivivax sp.]|jgi:hypothetical protein|nr:hypothetical protein [Rubrivivax sp.]